MNPPITKSLRRGTFLAALLGMLLAFMITSAMSQNLGSSGFGTRFEEILTNQVCIATTNTNSLSIGVAHPVFKGRGVALLVLSTSTNANTTAPVQYNIDLTPDGTNWSTTNGGVDVTFQQNGTNNYYTNLIADKFDNMKQWRLSQILPGTNSSTNSVYAGVDP